MRKCTYKTALTTGTKWENQHFRTYILGTLSTMCEWLVPRYLLSIVVLLSCWRPIGLDASLPDARTTDGS